MVAIRASKISSSRAETSKIRITVTGIAAETKEMDRTVVEVVAAVEIGTISTIAITSREVVDRVMVTVPETAKEEITSSSRGEDSRTGTRAAVVARRTAADPGIRVAMAMAASIGVAAIASSTSSTKSCACCRDHC